MATPPTSRLAALALAALAAACVAPDSESAAGATPYVIVLGTAQDGGLPQIGCEAPPCRAARLDPSARRLVTSLAIVDPRSGKRWLVDASPDLPEQIEALRGHPPSRASEASRPPLVDGVFLTHAHVGHYAGLLHFGREIYGARDVPVWGSERMGAFLSSNGPWDLLVEAGHVRLETIEPGRDVRLADDLSVSALRVPHRDEYTDTLAFVVRGPHRSLLYLPDIDKWERWSTRIEDVLARVDVALLDGTFFADGEIPGRSMAEIPHPFVTESLARFAALPASERSKVVFTHLNHTNPAATVGSPAWRAVVDAGCSVAVEGARHDL